MPGGSINILSCDGMIQCVQYLGFGAFSPQYADETLENRILHHDHWAQIQRVEHEVQHGLQRPFSRRAPDSDGTRSKDVKPMRNKSTRMKLLI